MRKLKLIFSILLITSLSAFGQNEQEYHQVVYAVDDVSQTFMNKYVSGNVWYNDYYFIEGNENHSVANTSGQFFIDRIYFEDSTGNRVFEPVGYYEWGDPLSFITVDIYQSTKYVGTLDISTQSGEYTFYPEYNFVGDVTFEYNLTELEGDGSNSDYAKVTIKVLPEVHKYKNPPICADDNIVTKQNTTISSNLLENDSDADGDSLSLTTVLFYQEFGLDTLPLNEDVAIFGYTYEDGSFVEAGNINIKEDGSYTFTHKNGFVGFILPLLYKATDNNGGLDSANLTIKILYDEQAGELYANNDFYIAKKCDTIRGNILLNDFNTAGNPFMVGELYAINENKEAGFGINYDGSLYKDSTVVDLSEGTLVMYYDGRFTFTPNEDCFVGTIAINYTIWSAPCIINNFNPETGQYDIPDTIAVDVLSNTNIQSFIQRSPIYRAIEQQGVHCLKSAKATLYLTLLPSKNLWTGAVDTVWATAGNWTDHPAEDGEDVIFATVENNGEAAQNDLYAAGEHTIGKLINESDKAFVVPAEAMVIVEDDVTGYSTIGDASKLVIKSAKDKANGTFILNRGCENSVYGSVEMYSKASDVEAFAMTDTNRYSPDRGDTTTLTYTWQYFGVPVESIALSSVNENMKQGNTSQRFWLRERKEEWNDPNHFYAKWRLMNASGTLNKFWGYEITQSQPDTYTFKGKLVTCDEDAQTTVTVTRKAAKVTAVTATTDEKIVRHELGENIVANSFTAALDVKNSIELDPALEQSVYIYNTGHLGQWQQQSGQNPGVADIPGAYLTISKNVSTSLWNSQIPSMQGFMVKYTDLETKYSEDSRKVKFLYKNLQKNKNPQKSPTSIGSEAGYLRLVLSGDHSYSDAVLLVEHEGLSEGFDNGWDGMKRGMPQSTLFVETSAGNMQIASDATIEGKYISFVGKSGVDYRLTIDKDNLGNYSDLCLIDLATKRVVRLSEEQTTYDFRAVSDGNIEKRFYISSISAGDDSSVIEGSNMLNAYATADGSIVVSNFTGEPCSLAIFDVAGKRVSSYTLRDDITEFASGLPQGVYMLTLEAAGEYSTIKVVLK